MIRSIAILVCFFAPCASTLAQAAAVGDTVLAFWKPNEAYWVATAIEKTEIGFIVLFEDGTRVNMPTAKIRKYDLKVGSVVYARWRIDDVKYYKGQIAQVVGRAFYIHYDDGSKGWAPMSWIAVR